VTGVRERLAGWGSTRADDEEAWLALARPDLRGEVQLTTDDERFVALERLLAHLGRRRPVMVWVDDAHASLQTLQLVRRSLQADPARLLWVLTLRDDAVASSPRAEEALAELRAAGAAEVSLQPLDAAERWALVDQGLGLAPRAAHRIDERSGGHPGFVVQAVRDLVLRGQLVGSSAGLDLAEGAMLELPADARALWVRRLHGVMQGLPDEAHDALRVAAVLGRQVVGRHWDQVSDASGVLRRALVDRLLAARLAHVTPDGWRFAHEWLRRAVLEAATADACRADHARCARLLAGELSAEELGLHWLAAGDRSMALPLLVRAVDHRRRKRGPGPAVALARQVEESMAARLEASDPWWGAVWALHARALAEGGGDGAAVSEVLDRIDANGARVGWERARGWALLLRCKRGLIVEHAVDDDALEQARALGVSAGDGELVVSCDEASAIRAYRKGDVAGARAGFARAVQGARGTERAEILAPILLNCSVLEARGGRLAEAQLACDEALEAARRAGLREMVARAHLLLGEIWRERGDERAVAHYERAMALYRSMASDQHVPCRVGLARLEGHHGRWRRAAHHAVQALHHLGNDGHAPLRLACHVVRLAAAVRGGDAAAAQVHASRIRPLLGAPGAVDAESLQTVEALGSFDAAWARLAAEMRTFHEGNAVRT
jgi:tetratricopeptide (TPR) repeat protein